MYHFTVCHVWGYIVGNMSEEALSYSQGEFFFKFIFNSGTVAFNLRFVNVLAVV